MNLSSILSDLIYTIPAVLIAIVLHEWAHGFISYKLGDPSPKADGRLSLNPLKHLDPVGTLCLLFFHFGWAKPVQVNPNYYKDRKMGMMLTALAGPLMNFIIAFLSLLIVLLTARFIPMLVNTYVGFYLSQVLIYTAILSIGLGVFNLIPIPPLDGSKILFAILPDDMYFAYMKYERYGSILLIVLLASGLFTSFLSPVSASIYNGMVNLIFTFL
ncbi:MAG: site-2 protease family protein [Erysipelotrichia bacterium]|nr:site-2 protease family protein [Erysipelotrichia bacterium]